LVLPLFAAGVDDTDGKFVAGIVDQGGNLLPVSTTPAVPVEKIAAGVVDTSGAPSLANIFKILKNILMLFRCFEPILKQPKQP
jgi:hypothetical protein